MPDSDSLAFERARMITGAQIRAARALLRWSASTLAEKSGVSRPTIERAEAADGFPEMRTRNMIAVRDAVELAGVIFLDSGEQKMGGSGVRFDACAVGNRSDMTTAS